MRIYVAGPMSRIPDQNRTAFRDAADQLRRAGHEPINPIDHAPPDAVELADELGPMFVGTPEYERLIQGCLKLVETCDAIFLLPGWADSTGAKRELKHALQYKKLVVDDITQLTGGQLNWVGESGLGPTRAYHGDAGFDLFVSQDTRVHVDQFVDVPLGIRVEFPPGVWGMLTGRSSTLRKRGLLVTQGIIDNGYRGELFAGVRNLSAGVVDLQRGERIAQLIPFEQTALKLSVCRVAGLSPSDRGESGFGSTGL